MVCFSSLKIIYLYVIFIVQSMSSLDLTQNNTIINSSCSIILTIVESNFLCLFFSDNINKIS